MTTQQASTTLPVRSAYDALDKLLADERLPRRLKLMIIELLDSAATPSAVWRIVARFERMLE